MGYEPPAWLARAASTFGRSAREQLSTGAGEPEDALRTALVALVKEIGMRHGLQVAGGRGDVVRPADAAGLRGAGQRGYLRLLDQVCAGPLITVEELTLAGVLPVPDARRQLVSGLPAAEPDQLL